MAETQVKTKKRVADHGEVYTAPREVNAMLDLVKQETERIESRFLEPACGNGNFLIEVLTRKLAKIAARYGKSRLEYERYVVSAVSSLYGIDILEDNVFECRSRLYNYFIAQYIDHFGLFRSDDLPNTVKYILDRNIVWGDALTLQTVGENPKPIVFSEWSLLMGGMVKRRDFSFFELLYQSENNSMPLFSETKIEGIGTDTWKKLWQAAREYSVSEVYKNKEFPYTEEDARCPLCHQTLDKETKKRLQNFETFIQGKLESDVREAEGRLKEKINNLPDCPANDVLESKCQAAGFDDIITDKLLKFFSNTGKILETLKANLIIVSENKTDNFPDTKELLEELSELSDKARKTAEQFEKDAESFDRNQTESELLELEAKKWISEQKEAITVEIGRLKKVEQYELWKKHTETARMTREASNISEKLITESYVARFNKELKKLGAASIAVELVKTRGDRGRIKHKIRLKNLAVAGTNVADILSDGEKRIVSLAAFLSDVTGKNVITPFILDDPISSLDQEYEEKAVERIVELSRDRQVIAFTHRLSFLGIISDKADDKLQIIHITRTPWGTTGEPEEFSVDRDKPQKAINELRDHRLVQARKAFDARNIESYNTIIKSICSDFRKLIERFIEIVLLADVIQRHRRAVNTVGKIQKLAKIEKQDCDLIDEMMSKYSCYEHSQSEEAPVTLPALEELEEDIRRIIEWNAEFTKRDMK